MQTLEERFWSKVHKTSTCWLWTGARVPEGYGSFRTPDGVKRAHRVAYELLLGSVPEGLQLDHLCRERRCVNPDHLEPVTQRENILRGDGVAAREARQTHCLRGHRFTPDNTKPNGPRGRECRRCRRDRDRENQRTRRASS